MSYSIDTKKYIELEKRWFKRNGLDLNLTNPKTINDKLEWLNFYETNPLKVKCADKILLRDYANEVIGEDICIPIIKIYETTKDINWDELPNEFVIKCNHGSGMNIIVKDKTKVDKRDMISKLNKWLSIDFAFKNGFEAHYHDIKHKVFVEKFMNDGHKTLHDYKFWCFNGNPKLYTINDGNGHGDIMYYSMDGKELNLYGVKSHSDYKKPDNFDEMVDYSKKLSEPFKFVRVDFYEVDGKVYLGEMTFVPGAGTFKYKNRKDNIEIGKLLEI